MDFRNLRDPILRKNFKNMSDIEKELAKNEVFKAVMMIRNSNLSPDIKHAIGLGIADGYASGSEASTEVFEKAAKLEKQQQALEAKRRPFSPMGDPFAPLGGLE